MGNKKRPHHGHGRNTKTLGDQHDSGNKHHEHKPAAHRQSWRATHLSLQSDGFVHDSGRPPSTHDRFSPITY